MKKYDYLIVGAGLYGATFAYEASKKGKKCLVIDKRNHIGGNIYCENTNGINVHKYGAHIFHTSDKEIWDYVNQFAEFNNYVNSPIANYKGEIYNLPFNMNTFSKLWGVVTPKEAQEKIEEQKSEYNITEPKNLEEQAISLVGKDIYLKLVKEYTEKQWGRDCKELPAFIIKRLPVRFTYDNNYFNDRYQGIPMGGYNVIIEKMLENADIELGVDYLKNKEEYDQKYTRIIEHKHFEFNKCKGTVITKEYPMDWKPGDEAYYPVNDEKNNTLFEKYKELAQKETNVIFGGRLGNYKYYDMDKVIKASLELANSELK